jgi:hypothetical protein
MVFLVRDTGIEPVLSVWKTDVLAAIRIPHARIHISLYFFVVYLTIFYLNFYYTIPLNIDYKRGVMKWQKKILTRQ